MKKKLFFICFFSLAINYSLSTYAQDITLVKDINDNYTPSNPSSSPNYLKFMGNNLFFTAGTIDVGYELWVYNAITKEVKLVKDLYQGNESSFPSEPTEFKGSLYFSAEYNVPGKPNWYTETALWKTDGTREGTTIVKSFKSNFVRKLIAVGNNLFFTASDDDAIGEELWVSDGTTAGTVLVKDIYSGANSSFPSDLTKLNNELFFVAKNETNKIGLWKSDGTTAGTILVKDILLNVIVYGSPNRFVEFNNELYFNASDGNTGYELWKTNGTEAGTYMIKDINEGEEDSNPGHFAVLEGILYFSADNGINGTELWKTNGTAISTTLVKDIYPGNISGNPTYLSVFSGNLYFAAQDETNGFELWKSDGTANGTQLFKDIAINNAGSHPWLYTEVAGNLYFTAYDETNGTELWKTDGTANGTTLVKDINDGGSFNQPKYLTKGMDNLYFVADDGNSGYEVWESDGTEEGTNAISNLKLGNDSSTPSNLTEALGSLFFTADNGVNGIELWKSNGTDIGTSLVKDIKNGNDNSSPNNLTEMAGNLFFVADDGINGSELWISNGTENGTNLLIDINSDDSSSFPNYLTKVDDNLFFTADDGVRGNELWKSDGTEAGTTLVKDIRNGNGSSYADNLTKLLGNLYFTVDDGNNGNELWKSDGTTNGTELLKDIKVGNSGSFPKNLTKAGNNLFFIADNGTNGNELWKSDGTNNGTALLKDIYSGNNNSSLDNLTEVEGNLYFTADDGTNGDELWKSDGTTNGTQLLKDIYSGNEGSFPNNLTKVGVNFYFTANDGVNGIELWKSNGTSNGTFLVKDINPGLVSSLPNNLIELAGHLYFTATTSNGQFLFKSDGTALGTNSVGYLNSVTTLKKYNNEILIVAFTEEYGEELYKYNPNSNTFYKTGNWSVASNWSKGVVPDNNDEATIKANETATLDVNNVSINKMTIKKYAKVIVGEYKDITITNTLNNFGKITLSSNEISSGVLFLNNPTTGNGSLIYERGGLSENNFSVISSPVKEQKILEFAKNTLNNISLNDAVDPLQYSLATFNDENPNGNKWEYIDANTDVNEKFKAAVGYSVSRNTNGSVFFTGTPIVASTNLTVKENKFNAIGNPFTTYFFANKNNNSSFLNDNISKLQIPALYIKDNSQDKYVAYTNLVASETKIIAPGQGFFVKTKPEETLLTFNADKRSLKPNAGNNTFNKTLNDPFYLKLNAENTNVKVTTAIIFDANASSSYDNNLDIENFNSDSFDLYSKINNVDTNYTIQSLFNENYDNLEIPIGIITNQETNVTFSVETFNFPDDVKVYLEDRAMNKTINLSEENYTINIDTSNNNRFYLKATENTLSSQNEILNLVSIYKESEEILKITGLQPIKTSIKIFSISGKEIISHLVDNKSQTSVNIKSLSSGLYIVSLTNSLGTKNKKIIIE